MKGRGGSRRLNVVAMCFGCFLGFNLIGTVVGAIAARGDDYPRRLPLSQRATIDGTWVLFVGFCLVIPAIFVGYDDGSISLTGILLGVAASIIGFVVGFNIGYPRYDV